MSLYASNNGFYLGSCYRVYAANDHLQMTLTVTLQYISYGFVFLIKRISTQTLLELRTVGMHYAECSVYGVIVNTLIFAFINKSL